MRNAARITTLAVGLSLSACASGPYGRNATVNRTLVGVAAGAALGGLAGQATGSGAFEGAVVGTVVGGAIGAVVKPPTAEPRVYYRDTRGACYYVDPDGRPVYVRKIRC